MTSIPAPTSPALMLLDPWQRAKLDPSDDALFYQVPRFVTHVDEAFLRRLTDLYRQLLRPGTRVLDLMSSWVSHLPPDTEFAHVEGHGMNADELADNPRLDRWWTQDLNRDPAMPLRDADYDAVLCAVSVQYLQRPEEVFAEMARVLRPGGVAVVSFSNRAFWEKAIAAWREATEAERVKLVRGYFRSVPGFGEPEEFIHPGRPPWLPWLANGTDPFYAVVAHRT